MVGIPGAMKLKTKSTGLTKYKPEYVDIAEKLKTAGFSNDDIGWALGVYGGGTIRSWMDSHPDFRAAIERGREKTRQRLVAKGIRAASGYDYEEHNEKWVTTNQIDEEGNPVEVMKERSVFKKHKPPDTKMLLSFLAVLDPNFRKIWTGEQRLNKSVTVKLSGKADQENIRQLFEGLLAENPDRLKRKSTVAVEVIPGDESGPESEGDFLASVPGLSSDSVQ